MNADDLERLDFMNEWLNELEKKKLDAYTEYCDANHKIWELKIEIEKEYQKTFKNLPDTHKETVKIR